MSRVCGRFSVFLLPIGACVLAACADDGGGDTGTASTTVTSTGTTGTTSTTATSTTSTGTTSTTGTTTTTPWVDPCLPDAAVELLALEVAEAGVAPTQQAFAATVSTDSTVAVVCVNDADPADVLFEESEVAGIFHELRLAGFLPGATYTCSAAATCPQQVGAPLTVTAAIAKAPNDFVALEVEVDAKVGMGGFWTLMPYSEEAFGQRSYISIWDDQGRARWWWEMPSGVGKWVEALYHPDRDAIAWGGGFHANGRPQLVSLWDGVVDGFDPAGWNREEYHHDGKLLPDGRFLSLEIRENRAGNTTWDGFGIRAQDLKTREVTFEYDSQKAVDDGVLEEGSGGWGGSDPYHANWMEWVETAEGPMVYVSLCLSKQIMAIDATTGEAPWLLGAGLGWSVVDADGNDLGDDALPQCQHGLEVSPEGNFLIYDNGQTRRQSYAGEWRIDGETKTATRLWEWTESGWHEDYMGDIDYLGDDRIFVTSATEWGIAELMDVHLATGVVGSRMTFSNGGFTYRAERYDGCAFFHHAGACASRMQRLDELRSLLLP